VGLKRPPATVTQHPREGARCNAPLLGVALAPVNGEKPYTRALEGVPTGMTSTPPAQAILGLRRLRGKLGLALDSGGPYVLLAGIRPSS